MIEPRVVTPQEAQEAPDSSPVPSYLSLLHTVATEPDRIRAAVMEALWWARGEDEEEIYRKYIDLLTEGE